MQLITLNNQMEIPSHPTTPPMKFPAPKKLDARKKSRTYSSGKNRDVFRSPRSTQFDENTEHMLTLRRCSRVPIIEPDNFSRDLADSSRPVDDGSRHPSGSSRLRLFLFVFEIEALDVDRYYIVDSYRHDGTYRDFTYRRSSKWHPKTLQ